MPDYFGASTGVVEGLRQNREAESHMAEMALAPLKQQQLQLQVDTLAKTSKANNDYAETARKLMAEMGPDVDSSRILSQLSMGAAAAGLPDKAQSLATASAQAGFREGLESQKKEAAAVAAGNQRLQELRLVGQLAGQVKSPEDWEKAKMIYNMQTGKTIDPSIAQYDPRMVKMLSESAMTEEQKLRLDILQQQADIKSRRQASQAELDRAKEEEQKARAALERKKAQMGDKEGGKGSSKVGKPEVAPITDMITSAYDVESKDIARVLARPISERALEIRKNNPSISASQAAQQAYSEARSAGAFSGLRAKRGTGPKPDAPQKALVEQFGQKYDPAYEYKVLPNGSLARKKRAQ